MPRVKRAAATRKRQWRKKRGRGWQRFVASLLAPPPRLSLLAHTLTSVGQELDLLEAEGADSLVLLEALGEAPLSHDEGVVDRQAVHVVDAQGLHLVVNLLPARKVLRGACRSEGTREGEKSDPLALEELRSGTVEPVEGILVVGLDAGAGDPRNLRDLRALGNRGGNRGSSGSAGEESARHCKGKLGL
jgi:hypothetical protein